MRKLLVLLALALAIASIPGVSSAQAAGPAATAGSTAESPKPRLHRAVGEVLSVDPAAKTLTVKTRGWRGRELSFAVDEAAAPTLADIHPGDRVRVQYAHRDGQLDAAAITKLPAKTKS